MKQVTQVIGILLVLGSLNFSPERLLAQEPKPPAPRPPTEVAPARFEAMVYEVQVPEARIAELESSALEAKAGTPQEFAKALGEFGKAKVLYKIDQTVNLYGEDIRLGAREPIVSDTRVTDKGTVVNSLRYEEVGLMLNLAANVPAPGEPRRQELCVQVTCQLTALYESELEAPAKLTRVRQVRLNHSESPRFGKPLVLFNVSASPGKDNLLPVAYVMRYVFREIKP